MRFVAQPPGAPLEGVLGYVQRLAHSNLLSVDEVCRALGLRLYGRPLLDQLDVVSKAAGIDLNIVEAPKFNPRKAYLNRAFERGRNDAVCPHCLDAHGHRLVSWRHRLVTTCATHSVDLIDHCPNCGQSLSTVAGGLFHCSCGYDLRYAPTIPADPMMVELTRLIEMRPPKGDVPLPPAWHHDIPGSIDVFLFRLACHQSNAGARKPSKIGQPRTVAEAQSLLSAAGAVLADWPKRFDAEIKRRLENGNADAVGVPSRLGKWYWSLLDFRGEGYADIWQRIESVSGSEFDGSYLYRNGEKRTSMSGSRWLSVSAAAKYLGVRFESLRHAVSVGEVEGRVSSPSPYYQHAVISREQVLRIKQLQREILTKKEACQVLGVTRRQFEHISELGFVTKTPSPLSFIKPGYVQSDLEVLVARIPISSELSAAEDILFAEINARFATDTRRYERTIAAILRGQVTAMHAAQNLGSFRFNADEIYSMLSLPSPLKPMSVEDVARLTGWKPQVISQWCEHGLLMATRKADRPRSPWQISPDNLARFQSSYVPLNELAIQLNTSSKALSEKLKSRKINVLSFADGKKESRGMLVRCADIARKALSVGN